MQQLFSVLERELRFRQQIMFHAVLQQIERAQPFLAEKFVRFFLSHFRIIQRVPFVGKVAGYVRTYQQTFRISVHHEIRKLLQVGQQSIFLVLPLQGLHKEQFQSLIRIEEHQRLATTRFQKALHIHGQLIARRGNRQSSPLLLHQLRFHQPVSGKSVADRRFLENIFQLRIDHIGKLQQVRIQGILHTVKVIAYRRINSPQQESDILFIDLVGEITFRQFIKRQVTSVIPFMPTDELAPVASVRHTVFQIKSQHQSHLILAFLCLRLI